MKRLLSISNYQFVTLSGLSKEGEKNRKEEEKQTQNKKNGY
jgi:hypothetical protein